MHAKNKRFWDCLIITVVMLLILCCILSCFSGPFIKGGLTQNGSFALSDGWFFADGTPVTEENRLNHPWGEGGTVSVFKNINPGDFGKALYFRNHRQDVTLIAGGKTLYDTYGDGNYYLPHCFNGHCMAVLPQAEKGYRVELRMGATSAAPCTVPVIMLDNAGTIEATLMEQSAPILLQSAIFITVALLSIFICILIVVNGGHTSVIFYGACYILCQTLWALCDADITDIIAINNEFTDVLGYFLIVLRITLLIAFGKEFVATQRRRPLYLCIGITCLFQLIQVVCYLLAVCRLYTLHKAGMLVSSLVLAIFSVCMLRELWHRRSMLIGLLTLGVVINTLIIFLAQIMYLSPVVAVTYQKIYRPFMLANDTIIVLVLIITVIMAGINAIKDKIKNATDIASFATNQAKKLRAKVERDSLTGLMNHKAIMDCVDRYACGNKPFAVGFIDLDDFRNVNTKYGHLVGDRVIKFVARTMLDTFKTNCGRHGGDEFVFVIDKPKQLEQAEALLTRYQQSLTKGINLSETGEQLSIGGSIGVVIVTKLPQNYNTILNMADDLMYQAKALGKNQFIIKKL